MGSYYQSKKIRVYEGEFKYEKIKDKDGNKYEGFVLKKDTKKENNDEE